METPEPKSTSKVLRWLLPIAALVVVGVATLAALAGDPGGEPAPPTTSSPAAVSVESDSSFQFNSLDEMVAASDLVVRGRVVATERGRLFGGEDPDAAIVSRVLTLAVSEVLKGDAVEAEEAPVRRLLVEEEAYLADGTPLVVDGLRTVERGDEGVWFLSAVEDPDFPGFVVINHQGRYLISGDALEGAGRPDSLVAEIEAMGTAALTAAVSASG